MKKSIIFLLVLGVSITTLFSDTIKIRQVETSSSEEKFVGQNVIDNDLNTRWSSEWSDPQWILFDLGKRYTVNKVELFWENAHAKEYELQVSNDSKKWYTVHKTDDCQGGNEKIKFQPVNVRYIRMFGKSRKTQWGYSLFEFKVYSTDQKPIPLSKLENDKSDDNIKNTKTVPKNNEQIKISNVTVSSYEKQFKPENIIDNSEKTRWSSEASDPQWVLFDLGKPQIIDKTELIWENACAKTYLLQVSNDAKKWYIVHSEDNGEPGKKTIEFKPVQARYVRLFGVSRSTGWGYSLYEWNLFKSNKTPVQLSVFDEFNAATILKLSPESPKTYYTLAAKLSNPKYYPNWMTPKQGYWTAVGTIDGYNEIKVCEDGTISGRKKFSVVPYIYFNNKLLSVKDFNINLSLLDNYLPIPILEGQYKDIGFKQKVFTHGKNEQDITYIKYTISNKGNNPISAKFYMTVRPFEVNPPWQHGGVIDLFSLENMQKNLLKINRHDYFAAVDKPDRFGALHYQEGDIIDYIKEGTLPDKKNVYDPIAGITGAFEFDLSLSPGKSKTYYFIIPTGEESQPLIQKKNIEKHYKETLSLWKQKLNKVIFKLPDTKLFDIVRSTISYLLINRDDNALLAGSGYYERTYIRDGAEMGISLLRMGLEKEVRDYIDWVTKFHLLPNGEVLAMINADGSAFEWGKTLNEFDGQGCFIYLIAEYYRYTRDKEFLKEKYPAVIKAVKYIQYLRAQNLKDEFKNGTLSQKRFYGILPRSVSHEGYIAPGQHSYWDDYWAIKGLRDAKQLALALNKKDDYDWLHKEEMDLTNCLLDSLKYTQQYKNINFIPGCADLGEADATSTSIALWPTEAVDYLPFDDLIRTMDTFYNEKFLPVRMDGKNKIDCLPYEMRIANAYLLLGEKEKALNMFYYYLTLIRPEQWNFWVELVHYKADKPDFIGDMPHSWAGAIYINLLRDMLVFEKHDRLLLGLGIDEKWLDTDQEIGIQDCPTYYGDISYTVKKDGNTIKVNVRGKADPAKGFVFKSPYIKKDIKSVKIDDKLWDNFTGKEIKFKQIPVEIIVTY